MNIKIIAVGKIKEKFLIEGIKEFLKRIKPYSCIEIFEINPIEIKDYNLIAKNLELEGEKILSYIKINSYVITLEINGNSFSSEQFAQIIENISTQGYNELIFVIGSSHGLGKNVSKRSDLKLSLSKMTFLHQFARLLLIEQIYRAFKIQKGETYHK
jgi:23S rRNA (pseudouridine1915-N3)-methyltransferase